MGEADEKGRPVTVTQTDGFDTGVENQTRQWGGPQSRLTVAFRGSRESGEVGGTTAAGTKGNKEGAMGTKGRNKGGDDVCVEQEG